MYLKVYIITKWIIGSSKINILSLINELIKDWLSI